MLAIISGVILVLFFAKLDELISMSYLTNFEVCNSKLGKFCQTPLSFSLKFQEELLLGWLD